MSQATTYRCLRHDHFDPDLLAGVISSGLLEHYLFEGGPCHLSHEHWRRNGVHLDLGRYNFGVWIRGQFRPEKMCFVFMRKQGHPAWVNGVEVGLGDLQVFPENCELAWRLYPDVEWAAIQISREDLQKAALTLENREVPLPARGMLVCHPGPEVMADLGQVFDLCGEKFHHEDRLGQYCHDLLLKVLVQAFGSVSMVDAAAESQRALLMLKTIKLAELHLLTHISTGYSSEEFARAVGMSERSLELCFTKVFGMSPRKWRESMCLNLARRRLAGNLRHPGMVAEIAAECGFPHAGRFSTIFRGLFGELPTKVTGVGEAESLWIT
ncbi:MAG: helix-turn-helix domain-containing protein [Verrucomicrobium sp.]